MSSLLVGYSRLCYGGVARSWLFRVEWAKRVVQGE
jgi:hypothetical protein